MTARVLRGVLGGLTLAASGVYTFVYLYRWEWNRALMSAAIFIAAEVAVMGSLLSQRLKVITRQLDTPAAAAPPAPSPAAVLRRERIHAAQPPARVGFAWLSRPEHMNVFVPVLMGAGVVMSGLAWMVERLARATASPLAERGLAARLDGLELPAHGFVTPEHQPLDLLRGPVGRPA
jgi:hypothetical protein